jgi:hypothetical protein
MKIPNKIRGEIVEMLNKFAETVYEDYGYEKDKTLQYVKNVIESLLPHKEDVADEKADKKVNLTFSGVQVIADVFHLSPDMLDMGTNTEEVSNVSTEVLTEFVTKNIVSTSTEEDVEVITEECIKVQEVEDNQGNITPQTPDKSPIRVHNVTMCSNTCISPRESEKHVRNTKDGYMVYKMSEFMEYFKYEYQNLKFTYDKAHLNSHVYRDLKGPPKKKEGFYIENNGDYIFVNMSCMYGIVPFIVTFSKSRSIENKPHMSRYILKTNVDIFRVMFPNMNFDTLIDNMNKNNQREFFLNKAFLNKMTLLLQFTFDMDPTFPMFIQK